MRVVKKNMFVITEDEKKILKIKIKAIIDDDNLYGNENYIKTNRIINLLEDLYGR